MPANFFLTFKICDPTPFKGMYYQLFTWQMPLDMGNWTFNIENIT